MDWRFLLIVITAGLSIGGCVLLALPGGDGRRKLVGDVALLLAVVTWAATVAIDRSMGVEVGGDCNYAHLHATEGRVI